MRITVPEAHPLAYPDQASVFLISTRTFPMELLACVRVRACVHACVCVKMTRRGASLWEPLHTKGSKCNPNVPPIEVGTRPKCYTQKVLCTLKSRGAGSFEYPFWPASANSPPPHCLLRLLQVGRQRCAKPGLLDLRVQFIDLSPPQTFSGWEEGGLAQRWQWCPACPSGRTIPTWSLGRAKCTTRASPPGTPTRALSCAPPVPAGQRVGRVDIK